MTTGSPHTVDSKLFESLEEMREAYNDLARRYVKNLDGEPLARFLEEANSFISRGRETGTLLENPDERWDAQSMLNFWATVLYRYRPNPEDEPLDTTLSLFGKPESAQPGANNIPFLAPPEPSNYVGRECFLSDLKQRLLAGRNIALYGVPGTGKTLIATKLAHDPEVREKFSDGVLWANLGNRSVVSAILDTWSQALSIPVNDSNRFDIEYREKVIRQAIGRRKMLLIIDDAWQADKALALKLGGPDCAHVLTTYLIPVALAFDTEGTVVTPGFSESDGLRLLTQYAPDEVKAQEDGAKELIAVLDGSPLAISVLAKWHKLQAQNSRHPDFKELGKSLLAAKESLEQARPLSRPAIEFEQVHTPPSLWATIDWCVGNLRDEERYVLQALAGFPPKPNSFSEEAAQYVSADRTGSLEMLTSYGLLESIDPRRYALHRAISEYLKQLKERADKPPDRRMVQFFLNVVKDQMTEKSLLEQEEKNILAALNLAFDRKMWKPLVEGTNALLDYFDRRGLYALAKEHLGQAQQAAEKLKDKSSLAMILLSLGEMEERLAQYSDAKVHLQSALKLAKEMEDRDAISRTLQGLGVVAMAQANYPQAESHLNEALTLAREMGNTQRESAIYTRLGWIERGRGHYDVSREYTQKGLELALANQDKGQIAELELSLGVLAFFEEKYELAKEHDRAGLRYAEELKDRRLRCGLLQALGGAEINLGEFKDAQGHLLESLRLSREIGHRWYSSVIWKEIGELRLKQKLLNSAYEAFVKALELARDVNGPELIGLALYGLARAAAARPNYAEARLHGQTCLTIFQSMGHQKGKEVQNWLRQFTSINNPDAD
jgi:tetratricopeptide (TPR) repeat protein